MIRKTVSLAARAIFLATVAALFAAFAVAEDPATDTVQVEMTTTLGNILIEIDTASAPLSAGNFLAMVDGAHYDGASFYRSVTLENDRGSPKIEVIQGGLGDRAAPFPAIAHESTEITGLRHVDGAISMARGEVGTASSEFFICIGDQPGLDHGAGRNPDRQGFAAFGRVVSGMDVVRAIQQQDAQGASDSDYTKGQILSNPVEIVRIRRRD
jgi:peptidyl-prolyl cis-trans isomerase A (cyclophilin A)